MKNIKLLVCYHKPDMLLKDEIMTPIHVGRAAAKQNMKPDAPDLKWLTENMIGDDTGENISLRNGTYNELTALYWAWKNYDKLGNPDYIGLMHYRRHFVLDEGKVKVYTTDKPDNVNQYLEKLNYSPERLSDMLDGCDFICHLGKVNNICYHYLQNHRIEDLNLALSFLDRKYKLAADEYLDSDIGNFCNMFIFPKNIFFDYCEWIFDILQKVENSIDVSEKRFFISERLTGIYIHNLMRERYKYKVLPISFIFEPVDIPIAIPLSEENPIMTATVIASALKNMKDGTSYTFYIMNNKEADSTTKEMFEKLKTISENCKFEFIRTDVEKQYFPLVLSELIPVERCLYLTEKMLVMKDLENFFRRCGVDDYNILGFSDGIYDIYSEEKRIEVNGMLTLNCERLRKHKIYDMCKKDIQAGKNCKDILNSICKNQVSYYPNWVVTFTDDPKPGKSDNIRLAEAKRTPLLYFCEDKSWEKNSSVYNVLWWEYAKETPSEFGFENMLSSVPTIRPERYGKTFDIGVVGWWYNENYGGTLTYYALNRFLESMGLSVLMIDRPSADFNDRPKADTIPRRFAFKYYNISDIYHPDRLGSLNSQCNAFISGSDQLYADWAWPYWGQTNHMDFAEPAKNIIGYASSFGNTYEADENFTMKSSYFLHRFNSLSVREDYAVDIVKENFGLDTVQVLDPVFMCDVNEYLKLVDKSPVKKENDYILSFFLDPDEKKREALLYLSKRFDLPYTNLIHAMDFEINKEKLNLDNIKANADVEDWLAYYKNADFIITDSFHGTCFAIIFKKQFISVANTDRGERRFESLLRGFGLMDRLVYDLDEIQNNEKLFEPIDYDKVYKIIGEKKEFSYKWLHNAVFNPPKKSDKEFNLLDKKMNDILKTRILKFQSMLSKQQKEIADMTARLKSLENK